MYPEPPICIFQGIHHIIEVFIPQENESHLQFTYAVLQLIKQTLLMFLAPFHDLVFNKLF